MMDWNLRFYENSLINREQSLRGSRLGAAILAVVLFFFPITRDVSGDLTKVIFMASIFIAMLGYQYHLQLKHLDSIKTYRKLVEELSRGEGVYKIVE